MKHKEESSLRNSLCREFLRDLVRRHRDEREFFTTGKTVVQFTRIYLFFLYARTHVSFRPVSREGNKIFREDRARMIRFGKIGREEKFFISRRNGMFFSRLPFFEERQLYTQSLLTDGRRINRNSGRGDKGERQIDSEARGRQ